MHGEFEKFLIVLAAVPAVGFHFLDKSRESIGIGILGVTREKLIVFLFGEVDDKRVERAREIAGAAEDHAPAILIDIREARLTVGEGHDIHQSDILGILAERGDERWVTEHRPDTFDLLEEEDGEVVEREWCLAIFGESEIDGVVHTLEVGHHTTHHTAREAATDEHRGADFILWVDIQAEEIVDKRLCKTAGLHISLHIDILDLKASVAEHSLNRDDIRVDHTPGERFDSGIDNIGTSLSHFEDRSHREAGACMTMILDKNIGVLLFNIKDESAEGMRAADASHILESDFVGAELDEFIDEIHIILDGMDRGVSDAEGGLGDHVSLLGIRDREFEIAGVVEAAERAHDVDALSLFNESHKTPNIARDAEHTEAVESTFEHVGLDASLIKRGSPGADGDIRVFAIHEVDLFKSAAISLDAVEAAHIDNSRGHLNELVDAGLILAGRLPHIAVDQTKFYFLRLHIIEKRTLKR